MSTSTEKNMVRRETVTGTFNAIRRARIDRWVWLALGIIVLLCTLISVTAFAAEPPLPVVAQSDPLADMIRTSGPAGGLVLVLGYFMRTWMADNKAQLLDFKAELKTVLTKLDNAVHSDGELRTLCMGLQVSLTDAIRRIERLERRSSGSHARAGE
jgi:hypothetical protein